LFGVDPSSNAEQYDQILENPFLGSRDFPLSTFSIDVDTASYANVRRFLTGGSLPPPDAVRIEELINYFTYDDPQPQGNAPFSVNMEVAECPWTPGHHLLRVGLKGREIASDKRPNSNLVFLLDVSGSMQAPNKLPLVKQAMGLLVRELSENDMVTIVTYAGSEGVALETTSGDRQAEILKAIDTLNASGSTHASAGIKLAYELARKCFIKEGANRVILCTDGDFNVGITNDDALVDLITTQAKGGVFLSVLGFGMGNLKDAKMEKLADHGNGNYGYIDTLREARKVLVEQMSGTLVAIAKDVKIQIEFNPATVVAYRQIGYENRVLAAKDFDDDTKDAGEIGAGHSVTALYEIVLAGHEKAVGPDQVPLKYQQRATSPATDPAEDRELTEAAASGELMTVKLRFKEPLGDKSELIEFPLKQEPKKFGAASENLRFASAVASFGMLLRGSEYRGGATMSAVSEIATASLGSDPSGYRAEFLDLVRRAQQLGK
jgi:Ca-activated chloride channel family protein